jgi:hypothetical protein
MFIPGPDFFSSLIPNLGSTNNKKEKGGKHFSQLTKNRNLSILNKKIVTKLSEIRVVDLVSEIRDPG